MDVSLILDNVLNPPILFFFLGMAAVVLRSDLVIPQPLPKLFSFYLLMSIGFHGGVELRRSGVGTETALTLGAAIAMAVIVPLYSFFVLRLKMSVHNAAAIAATYGSVSAVTFITAGSFLSSQGEHFSGHLVAAMALMESPAIIIGVMLVRRFDPAPKEAGNGELSWPTLLAEAFLNGSVFLLMGSLVIGVLTGDKGAKALDPFLKDLFKGMLCFFLLDMGLLAARRLGDLRRAGAFLILFALLAPLVNGALGLGLAKLIGMSPPDALMFTVLCASASYIAVPAAMSLAVPEASPSLYVSMALAITFPFNVILGIPLYRAAIQAIWGA